MPWDVPTDISARHCTLPWDVPWATVSISFHQSRLARLCSFFIRPLLLTTNLMSTASAFTVTMPTVTAREAVQEERRFFFERYQTLPQLIGGLKHAEQRVKEEWSNFRKYWRRQVNPPAGTKLTTKSIKASDRALYVQYRSSQLAETRPKASVVEIEQAEEQEELVPPTSTNGYKQRQEPALNAESNSQLVSVSQGRIVQPVANNQLDSFTQQLMPVIKGLLDRLDEQSLQLQQVFTHLEARASAAEDRKVAEEERKAAEEERKQAQEENRLERHYLRKRRAHLQQELVEQRIQALEDGESEYEEDVEIQLSSEDSENDDDRREEQVRLKRLEWGQKEDDYVGYRISMEEEVEEEEPEEEEEEEGEDEPEQKDDQEDEDEPKIKRSRMNRS